MKQRLFLLAFFTLASTSAAFAGPLNANSIRYNSANGLRTMSGTPATNVQQALDSLSASISSLVGTSHPSTWSGEVSDVQTGTLRKSGITVTFHPTSSISGTWTSTPLNAFSPSEVLAGVGPQGVSGNWGGSYTIVGDSVLASDVTNPNGEMLSAGRSSVALARGAAIELIDPAYLPFSVTILHKSH